MSELERDIGLAEVSASSIRRPRYIVTRHRAALIVVTGYFALVTFVALLLVSLERVRAKDDARNIDATILVAGILAVPFGLALRNVYRRARMPDWPS